VDDTGNKGDKPDHVGIHYLSNAPAFFEMVVAIGPDKGHETACKSIQLDIESFTTK
jgi:hypothetical protein